MKDMENNQWKVNKKALLRALYDMLEAYEVRVESHIPVDRG